MEKAASLWGKAGQRSLARSALVEAVAQAPSNKQDIGERTDGIPLFIEEMTKAVLEAESEGDARRTAAVVPGSAVP